MGSNITVRFGQGLSVQVSLGNAKMKKGFGIFNLPEKKTCIGATPFCLEHCYAQKASRQYKQTAPRREANLEASKADSYFFETALILAISRLSTRKGFRGMFRIHEAGDFYSQSYLDSWKYVASRFPNIKFLAFTKSFKLNFSGCPENLQIVWSVMEDTKVETIPAGGSKAYAGDCSTVDKVSTLECGGNCDSCGLCWDLSKMGQSVHFDMH